MSTSLVERPPKRYSDTLYLFPASAEDALPPLVVPPSLYDTPYSGPLPRGEDLPYDDGEPMESKRHWQQCVLLTSPLDEAWKSRTDYFLAANMGVYFSPLQAKNEDFRAPDVFVVMGVEKRERKSYVLWEENYKPPSIVIELLSPSTINEDKIRKKLIYQNTLKVPDYIWFDPFEDDFAGFELSNGVYQPKSRDAAGMYQCRQLGLALKRWTGEFMGCHADWLRWALPDGTLLPTGEESAEAQRRLAEEQKRNAEEQKRKAEEQKRRADELSNNNNGQLRRLEEQLRITDAHIRLLEEQTRKAEEESKLKQEALSRIEQLEALLKQHGIKS